LTINEKAKLSMTGARGVDEMSGLKDYAGNFPSPIAVGLRVADVRRAAEFYQQIGFKFVMAIPDENDGWLLCLLRYGSGSILLGALDHPQFPRTSRHRRLQAGPRGLGVRIDLTVPDLAATYTACVAAGCQVTAEPVQELWGDRNFSCLDPFGYEWQFTQPAERMTFEQLAQAAKVVWS
jgi:uncharacterized glyoxalase superfamily protein PhnB